MKTDWKKVKLEEIATFSNGVNFGKESYTSGVKLIGVSNFGNKYFPEYEELDEINEKVLRENDYLKDGDIVFVRSNGNKELVGRCMLIQNPPSPVTYSGFCIRARLNDTATNNPRFFAYYFKSKIFRKSMSNSAVGANIQNLNQGLLSNHEISLPPLETQQKIAHILSRYDEAIENNNKRIKLLEQMAQNLYKEWFVRFRFPGYENCEFENGIPVGWEIKRAQEIFDITIGRTPDRKQFEYFTNNEQDILWVSISDMKDNIFISKSFEYLTNEAVKKVNMPMVEADTVLLSFKLSVGRVSITTKLCCTNEAIAHCNTNDKDLLEYSYLYLKLFNYQNLGNTSAIGNAVNSTIIKKMKVVMPNRKLLEMFHNSTKGIFAIIKNLNYSNQNLAKQRDLLLPRLMSGKLEV